MYYIDTPTRRVDVFDHREDGTISSRRPSRRSRRAQASPTASPSTPTAVWVALWDGERCAATRRPANWTG